MSNLLLIGACAGGIAGAIIASAAHLAPLFGAGNFIRDTDEIRIFGRGISRREAHLLGILIHLVIAVLAGAGFAYGVEQGLLSGFRILPMLGWSTLVALITGGVIMPLEGHGFFGTKHDPWFIVDAFCTNLLWGGLYILLVRLWI